MNDEEINELQGVDSQREALEEMSQALLDKLNAMVVEQEARAQEFAARSHSLSSLPQQPSPQSIPMPEPEPQPVQEPPAAASRSSSVKVPPLVRQVQQAVESLPPHRRRASSPAPKSPRPAKPKAEEGGINVGALVLIGVVLFIFLRSCN